MTTNRDSHESKPCGCCEGVQAITPVPIFNRPGQDALQYHLGTHGAFLKTMLARLSSSDYPALAGLTTRDRDDPAIALLDAWATVADVLAFYQERIANEGYLRTAQEQRSILELGRLVNEGDVLDTGRAASTYLAFELDSPAPGISPEVLIRKNTRAQTLPGQGELPQPFETTADLKARAEWTTLKPRMTEPMELTSGTTELYLKGTATNLKPNDPLLFVLSEDDRVLRRVKSIELQPEQNRTRVTLQHKLGFSAASDFAPEVFALRVTASVFGHNAPLRPILNTQGAIIGHEEWSLTEPEKVFGDLSVRFVVNIVPKQTKTPIPEMQEEHMARLKSEIEIVVAVGDHSVTKSYQWPLDRQKIIKVLDPQNNQIETVTVNRVDRDKAVLMFQFETYRKTLRFPLGEIGGGGAAAAASIAVQKEKTVGQGQAESARYLHLNGIYPMIAPDSWVVIEKSTGEFNTPIVKQATAVGETSRAVYGISGRCTCLDLGEDGWSTQNDFSLIRTSTVYTQSEKLQIVEQPSADPVKGDFIVLDRHLINFTAPHLLIVSGKRMRVKVLKEITGTTETMAEISLHVGDVLVMAQAPEDVNGQTQWVLINENGLKIMVTGSKEELLIVSSEPGDKAVGEVALVNEVTTNSGQTSFTLTNPLARQYDRTTVTIYANVVHALHGEAREEVLGSADASRPFQEFRLSHKPLSFIADATTTGVRSTLEIFVNDLRWHEVTRLSDFGPGDRVYVTARDEEDNITVRFGDGHHGLRPPTGVNNIMARYRTGLGVAGNVNAWQINQLVTRPLGVKGVQNPLPASGGDNRDDIADARWNVPLPVMAIDRVVSLQDYENFARACTSIGKANAVFERDDQNVLHVHLTIAGDDEDVKLGTNECSRVSDNLKSHGDLDTDVQVVVCKDIHLCLTANIALAPDYLWEKVEQDVRKALLEKLGFKQRSLGQDAMLSEAISIIQSIAGVAYVNL